MPPTLSEKTPTFQETGAVQNPKASQSQIDSLRSAFESYSPQLLNALANRIKRDSNLDYIKARESALDLLSELYVEAIKSADRFDSEMSPRSWLLGIGYNLVKRKFRSDGKTFAREQLATDITASQGEDELESQIFDRLTNPSDHVQMHSSLESEAAVEEMLSLVSKDEREVIELAVIENFAGEQLASKLGIKPAAARQRISRALRNLSAAYRKHLQAGGLS